MMSCNVKDTTEHSRGQHYKFFIDQHNCILSDSKVITHIDDRHRKNHYLMRPGTSCTYSTHGWQQLAHFKNKFLSTYLINFGIVRKSLICNVLLKYVQCLCRQWNRQSVKTYLLHNPYKITDKLHKLKIKFLLTVHTVIPEENLYNLQNKL